MPVAGRNRRLDDGFRLVIAHLPRSQGNLRNPLAIIQFVTLVDNHGAAPFLRITFNITL
jgi:hypothetical protein